MASYSRPSPSKARTAAPERSRSTSRAWWAECSGRRTRAPGPASGTWNRGTVMPRLSRPPSHETGPLAVHARGERPGFRADRHHLGHVLGQHPGEDERAPGADQGRELAHARAEQGGREVGQDEVEGARTEGGPPVGPHHGEIDAVEPRVPAGPLRGLRVQVGGD